MMKLIVATVLLIAVAVSGFTIPQQPVRTTTSLEMGLFDGFKPKPKPKEPKKIGGMDVSVFGGKGKKITIREDEDNAMWVDDGKGGRKKAT